MELSGPSRPQGKETRYKNCPSCGGDNWPVSLNESTGAWTCYRCGAGGAESRGVDANVLRERLTRVTRALPEWHECPLPPWRPLTRTGLKYLRDRGISTPQDFGLAETAEGGRIIIPYFGELGRIVYWVTRSFVPDGQPKYIGAPGSKPPYVLPRWEASDDVVFVEGPVDAIVHWLATGRATIALGGKSLPRYLAGTINALAPGKRTLMLDPDALGATLTLGQELGAEVVRLPGGMDPAEYWRTHANT